MVKLLQENGKLVPHRLVYSTSRDISPIYPSQIRCMHCGTKNKHNFQAEVICVKCGKIHEVIFFVNEELEEFVC